ncbi:MAG: hypothetical protein KA339_05480 [Candidatus Kapabacteria bacterium]|nr:hypothetical protein [Candidatus Kapabacteria bacterium]
MEILKEILRIVTTKSDKTKVFPELVEDDEASTSLAGRYLNGMANDSFTTDEEAARDLYGTGASDQRYRTLKSRTYERLMHSVLFLQVKQPEHSEYLSYYYKCMRNQIGAQTLMRFASRRAGYAVALKTLTIAQKYEFTDICVSLAVLLRESAAVWNKRTTFLHHHREVVKHLGALKCEYDADFLLDHIKMEMTVTSRKRSYLIDLHKDAMIKVESMRKEHNTHGLRLSSIRAAVNYYDFVEDFAGVIKECDRAIEYLNSVPHLSQRARHGEFMLQKMSAALYLRRYDEAFTLADKCIDSFTVAGNNWYFASDLAFVAAINIQDYDKAELLYTRATTHRKYNMLSENTRERWIIYGAYLLLAEQLGLYSPQQSRAKTFRLSTYLNSLPEESKSKKVYNVLIIVSHVFYLMINGDYDTAEKRIDYLRVYSSRYLKEKHFNRVRIFLRLIQSFPKHSFIPSEIRKHTKDIYDELIASSHDPMPSETNELIPFEVMFESLLKTVERSES